MKIKVGRDHDTLQRQAVHLTAVDARARHIEMSAEGRETGGGTAKGLDGTPTCGRCPTGLTEVVATASVDLTGKIMQVGRGMIQGVSHQLFLQFVAAVQSHLEPLAASAPPRPASAPDAASLRPMRPASSRPRCCRRRCPAPRSRRRRIRIVPLVMSVIWAAIQRFFRRLLGRQPA